MKNFFLLLLVSLLLPSLASAQTVPGTLPVQGILTDSNDQAVNDNVAITFSIYDTADQVVHTETLAVDVVNGFFSVDLGAGTTAIDLNIFQEGDAVELGIKVGSNDEMSPRLRFGSVPYAVAAEYAVSALDAENAIFANSAQNAQTAQNAVNAENVNDGTITEAKLANAIPVYEVTNTFCEAEVGTIMTNPTCRARQFNVDQCTNTCTGIERRARNCNGQCDCVAHLCAIGLPCPPTRGPNCPNQPVAGYIVGP